MAEIKQRKKKSIHFWYVLILYFVTFGITNAVTDVNNTRIATTNQNTSNVLPNEQNIDRDKKTFLRLIPKENISQPLNTRHRKDISRNALLLQTRHLQHNNLCNDTTMPSQQLQNFSILNIDKTADQVTSDTNLNYNYRTTSANSPNFIFKPNDTNNNVSFYSFLNKLKNDFLSTTISNQNSNEKITRKPRSSKAQEFVCRCLDDECKNQKCDPQENSSEEEENRNERFVRKEIRPYPSFIVNTEDTMQRPATYKRQLLYNPRSPFVNVYYPSSGVDNLEPSEVIIPYVPKADRINFEVEKIPYIAESNDQSKNERNVPKRHIGRLLRRLKNSRGYIPDDFDSLGDNINGKILGSSEIMAQNELWNKLKETFNLFKGMTNYIDVYIRPADCNNCLQKPENIRPITPSSATTREFERNKTTESTHKSEEFEKKKTAIGSPEPAKPAIFIQDEVKMKKEEDTNKESEEIKAQEVIVTDPVPENKNRKLSFKNHGAVFMSDLQPTYNRKGYKNLMLNEYPGSYENSKYSRSMMMDEDLPDRYNSRTYPAHLSRDFRTSRPRRISEVTLLNAIMNEIINDFVNEKRTRKQNVYNHISELMKSGETELLPQIKDTPILKHLFKLKPVRAMLLNRVKEILNEVEQMASQVSTKHLTDDMIEENLEEFIENIPIVHPTVATTLAVEDESQEWKSSLMEDLQRSEASTRLGNLLDEVGEFLEQTGMSVLVARNPVVKNVIVDTIEFDLVNNRRYDVSREEIRNAVNYYLYPEFGARLLPIRKIRKKEITETPITEATSLPTNRKNFKTSTFKTSSVDETSDDSKTAKVKRMKTRSSTEKPIEVILNSEDKTPTAYYSEEGIVNYLSKHRNENFGRRGNGKLAAEDHVQGLSSTTMSFNDQISRRSKPSIDNFKNEDESKVAEDSSNELSSDNSEQESYPAKYSNPPEKYTTSMDFEIETENNDYVYPSRSRRTDDNFRTRDRKTRKNPKKTPAERSTSTENEENSNDSNSEKFMNFNAKKRASKNIGALKSYSKKKEQPDYEASKDAGFKDKTFVLEDEESSHENSEYSAKTLESEQGDEDQKYSGDLNYDSVGFPKQVSVLSPGEINQRVNVNLTSETSSEYDPENEASIVDSKSVKEDYHLSEEDYSAPSINDLRDYTESSVQETLPSYRKSQVFEENSDDSEARVEDVSSSSLYKAESNWKNRKKGAENSPERDRNNYDLGTTHPMSVDLLTTRKQKMYQSEMKENSSDPSLFYVENKVKLPIRIIKRHDNSSLLTLFGSICKKVLNDKCPCSTAEKRSIVKKESNQRPDNVRSKRSNTVFMQKYKVNNNENNTFQIYIASRDEGSTLDEKNGNYVSPTESENGIFTVDNYFVNDVQKKDEKTMDNNESIQNFISIEKVPEKDGIRILLDAVNNLESMDQRDVLQLIDMVELKRN